MSKKIILITGTTSGIGKELSSYYLGLENLIIAIDRNVNNAFKDKTNFKQVITDITDYTKVDNIIKKLIHENNLPEIFILNAGINIYDNEEFFNVLDFKRCFDINFYGTFNFVSSIEKNNIINKSIIFFSSTSNIIPNPAALGYHSSKFLLKKLSPYLSNKNNYKVAILGPIKTNISRELNHPIGLTGFIYKILTVETKPLCVKFDKFLNNKKTYFYYTIKSLFIYYIIKIILFFFPFLYKGGKTKKK